MQDQVASCASDRLPTIGGFKIPLQLMMPIESSGCYLEKEMAAHSSILAWEIPWTEEPGLLQSIGFQGARCNWATKQQSVIGAFNPFTFKVITDKCDPVAIYFIVLGSNLYTIFVFPV